MIPKFIDRVGPFKMNDFYLLENKNVYRKEI